MFFLKVLFLGLYFKTLIIFLWIVPWFSRQGLQWCICWQASICSVPLSPVNLPTPFLFVLFMFTYLIFVFYITMLSVVSLPHCTFYKRFYFSERGEGREKEKERYWCARRETAFGCLSHASSRGPGPQPRHVPWQGIKPATFQFTYQCSIHWATPALLLYFF